MRFLPKKFRRKSALEQFIERLEFEGFTVLDDYDGSGNWCVLSKTLRLLGHIDNTACFIYTPEDRERKEPGVMRIIELTRHLLEGGLAVSLSDGRKIPIETTP
ncbi:MAG: hypothetical protein HYW97_01305 [Candidatus Wildermuthbacteria bacterium]|nr:hypothetical protein [Candidatus Wildermuthbacteria bacterium]